MINFYTWSTPNGRKVAIALEELTLPYNVIRVDLKAGDQKQPQFLRINPNGRIPAIVDRACDDFAVFESGAILIYLAEKTGLLMPTDRKRRSVVIQWLMFQMGGLGPMQGQANVFFRYFPEKIPSVIARYQNEVKRLYSVMDERLKDEQYLAGDFSIADVATFPWVAQYEWSGVDLNEFQHLKRWYDFVAQRPGVQRGMVIPEPQRAPDRILETARQIIS